MTLTPDSPQSWRTFVGIDPEVIEALKESQPERTLAELAKNENLITK